MSETKQKLDANIPREVVSTRTQAGFEISYLETWYVIDRLNQVLGQGNWSYQTINTTKVYEGKVNDKHSVSYTATVILGAFVDGKHTQFSDVGYGDGFDKNSPGKAHELAIKEAVSDAVKRCAKNLGRSMGLALYDKTQEYVGTNTSRSNIAVRQENSVPGDTVTGSTTISMGTNSKRSITKDLIGEAFKVLELQKKVTKESFKKDFLGGRGLSTIPQSELQSIYEKVTETLNT